MLENEEKRLIENFDGVKWNGKEDADLEEVASDFQKEHDIQATQRFVPIGTIVGVGASNDKFMIIGYNSNDKDYLACLYPFGVDLDGKFYSFNHTDIVRFYHVGYFDLKGRAYQSELNEKGMSL